MADELTKDDIRAEAMAAMGPEMGELYTELHGSLAGLHVKWGEYKTLFATSVDRIELMNRTAPHFFVFLQETLIADLLLHMTRITDPATSRIKGGEVVWNLSVCHLVALVPSPQPAALGSLASTVETRTDFARDWRNRQLAHTDWLTARGRHAEPLQELTKTAIEGALVALRGLMNWFEVTYLHTLVAYEQTIEALGGAAALLRHLDRGSAAMRIDRDDREGA